MENMGKPICGSDSQVGEYDVTVHVVGLCELLRWQYAIIDYEQGD